MERTAKKYVYPWYAISTALIFAASVISPCVSVATVPAAGALTYFLSLTLGVWLLPATAAAYAIAGVCVRGACLFPIGGAAVVLSLTMPRALRKKLTLWQEILLCAAACLLATLAATGAFALEGGEGIRDAVIATYEDLGSDPIAFWLAKRHYRGLDAQTLGHAPYARADELYRADVMRAYAQAVGRETENHMLWYLSGFGVFTGGAVCAGAVSLAKCDGTLQTEPRMRDLRLGRQYLLGGVLPALAFALTALYDPMRDVATSVVNVMVTLPTALCGMTLVFHSLCRIPRKAGRTVAVACFWLVMAAAAFFYEWGLLVFGFLGLADCVLDVRRLLDWAMS